MKDEKPVWHEDNDKKFSKDYSQPYWQSDAAKSYINGHNTAMQKVREYLEAQKQKG